MIALLSCEAEYMITTEAGKEVLSIARFLACYKFRFPSQSINLCVNNKRAILLIENPKFYQKKSTLKYVGTGFEKKSSKKRFNFLHFYKENAS